MDGASVFAAASASTEGDAIAPVRREIRAL
jgi:hypothetical protein